MNSFRKHIHECEYKTQIMKMKTFYFRFFSIFVFICQFSQRILIRLMRQCTLEMLSILKRKHMHAHTRAHMDVWIEMAGNAKCLFPTYGFSVIRQQLSCLKPVRVCIA